MGWIHHNLLPLQPPAPHQTNKKSGIHCTKSALDAAAVLQH